MRKVIRALRRAGAKRITFLAIADATKSNPEDLQPYNPNVNPDLDEATEKLLNQIENPDLKILALILLKKLNKLDELSEIRRLLQSELWHRELHLISNSAVKPKGLKAVLKPDLDTSQKYADVVYIYEENGQTVARIVETKGLVSKDSEEDIREKFRNTVEYIKGLGFEVDRYELYLVIPKRLEEYITVPDIEGVEVVKVNPEVVNDMQHPIYPENHP